MKTTGARFWTLIAAAWVAALIWWACASYRANHTAWPWQPEKPPAIPQAQAVDPALVGR